MTALKYAVCFKDSGVNKVNAAVLKDSAECQNNNKFKE